MRFHSTRRPHAALSLVTLLASILLHACSEDPGNAAQGERAPKETSGTAATQGLCPLFTREEIGALLGTPVDAGYPAGVMMEKACQWDGSTDEDAVAHIQWLPLDAWTPPKGARGFEQVDGIGREAYVVPELGGWAAGALRDDGGAAVSVAGGTSKRETALELLRELLARL
jgi:hypothetical protein